MEEAVTCVVCSEVYTTGTRDPLVLPCGHSLCRACVNLVMTSYPEKAFACPICRTSYPFLSIYNLPVNFSLLSLATAFIENKVELCQEHGEPLAYWCRNCRKGVCGLCILTGHLREGHHVITANVLVEEKKRVVISLASDTLRLLEDVQRKASGKFESSLANLMLVSAANGLISGMAEQVLSLKEKVYKSKGIEQILLHDATLKEQILAKNFGKIFKEANITPEPIVVEVEDMGMDEPGMESCPSLLNKEEEALSRCGSTTPSSNADTSEAGSRSSETSEEEAAPTSRGRGQINCKIHIGDGRHARLVWVDDQLLMYALATATEPNPDVLIQFSAIQGLLDQDHPTVFLELSAGGRDLGRIFIRLRGRMRRAQQFLALCMGTLGPSFVGSLFSRVQDKGMPGETLVGGKYFCQRAKKFVSKGVLNDLEFGGEHGDVDKAGYVADYSGGLDKHGTLFGICASDNADMDLVIPVFGEVTAGLEVVSAASRYDPVTDVTISQSGIVVPSQISQDPLDSEMNSLSIG